uniref:Four-carbon acid sugar kinase nucleotide binding domain-containing protein n=1 Tax=Synechococcus elongatus (strain ATCC 33912 / PCC 7942 / FACHB-805) TaxID=1140 RepID=Q935X3_SYNE7|nr:unknown [Synechococcus elongatus PCC 7942 = FACHB-805]
MHSCPLLLRWDVETLVTGLRHPSLLCFILAAARTREICRNLQQAIAQLRLQHWLIISRGDSTLRGHFWTEPQAIAAELGPFQAQFLVPAFLEGGRITRQGWHLLRTPRGDRPLHEAEFDQDPLFGYRTSYLHTFLATQAEDPSLSDRIPVLTADNLETAFTTASARAIAVVSMQNPDHCTVASLKRSLTTVTTLSQCCSYSVLGATAAAPIAPQQFGQLNPQHRTGVVVVGSWTTISTGQLEALLEQPQVAAIAVPIEPFVESDGRDRPPLAEDLDRQIQQALQQGQTPVIFTERQFHACASPEQQQQLSRAIADFLAERVCALPAEIGYLICKGGITTNTILANLDAAIVELRGQIRTGVNLVQLPASHQKFPSLPIVSFPGNIGDRHDLVTIQQILSSAS